VAVLAGLVALVAMAEVRAVMVASAALKVAMAAMEGLAAVPKDQACRCHILVGIAAQHQHVLCPGSTDG